MRMILMKTIGQLVKAIAVNYSSFYKQNDIRLATEYGSDEYIKAGELREMYRERLLNDIETLKALGIDPELNIW